MARRTCIFCEAQPPLTNEHVIPVWLQEYVGGKEPGQFRGTWTNFVGMPIDVRRASSNSHTLGTVCGNCNNGWMSKLESAFGAILPRLEENMTPRCFSRSERAVIARWIVKTGLVAHLSSNYRRILPEDFPTSLAKASVIPGGIKVFGGQVASKKAVHWVQANLPLSVLPESDVPSFDPTRSTFVFVLAIRGIFLGFGWHGLDRNSVKISLPDDSMHEFYPHPNSARRLELFDDLRMAAMEVGLIPK